MTQPGIAARTHVARMRRIGGFGLLSAWCLFLAYHGYNKVFGGGGLKGTVWL